MTKDQLKEQLRNYRHLEAERLQILAEYNALADPRGASLDGSPRSPGSGDPMIGIVTKRQALADRYRGKLEELAEAQAEVENLIERLDPLARRLMRLRYIKGKTWEQVSDAINYSWRRTHDLHNAALQQILDTLPTCWDLCPGHDCKVCPEYAALVHDHR